MPNNWKKYKLSDTLEIKYGKDHKKVENGNIPIYGTGGIMRYGNQFLYDDESILIPRKGSLNNIYYINEPFWTVDTLFWSKINKEAVFPKFLFYNLKILDFANMDVGTAIPSLTTNLLNKIEIKLPPLPEQKAIAQILSAIDDKIENNLAINKTLEDIAMALYKHWFVDFDFPVIKESHPELVSGSQSIGYKSAGGEFVDSELGPIPKGWEVKKVKDFGEVITGKTPSQKFPEHFGSDLAFVTPTDFKNYGKHILNAARYISISGMEKHKKNIIPENSVIVTCIGSDMGKVSISKIPCLTNQQINSLKTNDYLFMYCFFVHNYSLLKRLAGDGTTMPIINKSTFENIDVLYSGKNNLEAFENKLKKWDNQIFNNTQENQTLINLRDTLLPKLISGEVRLKEFREQVEQIISN